MGTTLHEYRVWAAGDTPPTAPNFKAFARRIAAEDFGQKRRGALPLVVHVERNGKVETFDLILHNDRPAATPRDG